MKKMIVMLVVVLLLASLIQVALADPDITKIPATGGSCHMDASAWLPGTGPGNANGVKPGERGMYHVHTKDMPDHVGDDGYTFGAINMEKIYEAHGCLP